MLCRCGCGEIAEFAAKHVRSSLRSDDRLLQFEVRDMGFTTPCHVWTGNLSGSRGKGQPGIYGKIFIHGRYRSAHRYIYEIEVGPIPPGKHLHHKCNVTQCVNPDHLEPTTPRENNRQKRSTKITEKDVPLIRASKLPPDVLAQILGVSSSLIYQIRSGAAWADVHDAQSTNTAA